MNQYPVVASDNCFIIMRAEQKNMAKTMTRIRIRISIQMIIGIIVKTIKATSTITLAILIKREAKQLEKRDANV